MDSSEIAAEQEEQHSADSFESLSSDEEDYTAEEIRFPKNPNHWARLFEIYQRNAQRIRRLTEEVKNIQQRIVDLQRLKSEKESIDFVENDEEEEKESQFIVKYELERRQRQQELKNLKRIYLKLKLMTSEEDILKDEKMSQLLLQWIKNNKEVVSYKINDDYLILLCRERVKPKPKVQKHTHSSVDEDLKVSKKVNRDNSRSREGSIDQKRKKKDEWNYTIRWMDLNNYKKRLITSKKELIPSAVKSQVNEVKTVKQSIQMVFVEEVNEETLIASKNQAEKDVYLMNLLKLGHKYQSKLTHCTYSKKLDLFFLAETGTKIQIVSSKGEIVKNLKLDSYDQVNLLEIRNDHLWVGTRQGILRIYNLINSWQLNHTFFCVPKDKCEVNHYLLCKEEKINKIVFISSLTVFEMNLNTFKTIKIGEISEEKSIIISDYLITSQKAFNIIYKDSSFTLNVCEKLTNWLSIFKQTYSQTSIIEICLDTASKQYKILVADLYGNIELIFV